MVTNDQLTSLSLHVNQPSHSSNKAIWNFDLETTRSRSWVWLKANSQPVFNWFAFFVSHQSDNNSWDTAILKFDLEKSEVKVMGEVKSWGHIVHPVSNWCTSFLFHIYRTNHSWNMSNRVFDLEKTHPKFSKKIWQKTKFPTEFLHNLIR